jgi:DNA-binding response OmpR family regulator
MSSILVVEDDASILRGITDILRAEGYETHVATDGESGYRQALAKKPELLILDVMLPKMSGFEVCQKLRSAGFESPVLMLTARGEETDRVVGLDLGADDYVTKPFSVRELLARVRALRRTTAGNPMPDELRFDDIVVDFSSFTAIRGGEAIELTPKEFGLLRLLASHAGKVITRDDLLNKVWGSDRYPSPRTVDTHVASLRAKIERDPAAPKRLQTVHGVGYKLTLS